MTQAARQGRMAAMISKPTCRYRPIYDKKPRRGHQCRGEVQFLNSSHLQRVVFAFLSEVQPRWHLKVGRGKFSVGIHIGTDK